MRRLLSLLLALCVALTLVSCAGGDPVTTDSIRDDSVDAEITTAERSLEELVLANAPEVYDVAVRISINPSFILYLNAGRMDVISSIPVNADAEKIYPRMALDGRRIEDAVRELISVAAEEKYLSDNGNVSMTVIRSFVQDEAVTQLTDTIEDTIRQEARNLNITVGVTTDIPDSSRMAEEPDPQNEPAPQDDPNTPVNEPPESTPDDVQPTEDDDGGAASHGDAGNQPGEQPGDQPGEDTADDTQKVEGCPVCWGSGTCSRCEGAGTIVCEVCGGSGYEICSQCSGEGRMKCNCGDGKCWHCHGTAQLPCETCDGTDENCPACHGSGWVHCNSCENGECSQCGGTLYTGECGKCGGTGHTACFPCQGSGITDCQGCHGDGLCEVCHGTGINPKN